MDIPNSLDFTERDVDSLSMSLIKTLNLSHLVVASANVSSMTEFFKEVFGITPHYANKEFADFALPSGARVALFKPVGKSADYFDATGSRKAVAFGIMVENVDEFYKHCTSLAEKFSLTFSGPPKEHPWGEPSFLLIDPDGNRWEITQSPSKEGILVNKTAKSS